MSTEIYYFSGTGNSLAVARDVASALDGQLISIPRVLGQASVRTEASLVGVVFPMYHYGLPGIVRRFIEQTENLGSAYLFAICTYGNDPGICLERFKALVEANGSSLAAGFAVRMPYNYVVPTFSPPFTSFTLQEIPAYRQHAMFADWHGRLAVICDYIRNRERGRLETKAAWLGHLADALNLRNTLQKAVWMRVAGVGPTPGLTFEDAMPLMDHGFSCGDNCARCGTCRRVCPVHNIELSDGKPSWQHHCEQCFACLHWCPQAAIQFGAKTPGKQRYHHPDVTLADMLSE